jgi:hypothetical protein
MQLSKPPRPKATRKRLKKEILSDDFKKRKIFWKIFRMGKFSTAHHYIQWIKNALRIKLPELVCVQPVPLAAWFKA